MKKLITVICAFALCTAMLCGCDGGGGDKTLDINAAKDAALAVQVKLEDGSMGSAFGTLTEETPEVLKDFYNIDVTGMKEYVILTPLMNVNACLLMIIIPEDGQKDVVKNNISRALTDYEQRWDLYLPQQADYVHNRTETEVGGCLVYIISTDNSAVLSAIRGTMD